MLVDPHDLAGGTHFGAQQRVHHAPLRGAEPREGQHSLFDGHWSPGGQHGPVPGCRKQARERVARALPQLRDADAGADMRCRFGQLHSRGLRDEGHRAGGTRIGFDHVEHVRGYGELDVDQTTNAHSGGDPQRRLAHPVQHIRSQRDRRQDARGVAGMDAGLFDVLHHPAEVQLFAVVEGVDVDLYGVLQEAVHQHRMLRCHLGGMGDVPGQAGLVIDDLHAAPAQHIRGAHQHGVSDAVGYPLRVLEADGGAVLRRDQLRALQHLIELAAVLGQVDRLRAGSQDPHAGRGELMGELQRGLAAQLDEDAVDSPGALLGSDDLQHVLQCEGLEVQPGRDVVVSGDRLGVAVDHDRLVPGLAQCHRGVDAGVVEFNPLADPVGPGPEDDHRGLLVLGDLIFHVIGRIVVRRVRLELRCAGVHRLVDRANAQRVADSAHHGRVHMPQIADLGIGKAVPLGSA